jgi:hypothetical protein
MNPYVSRYGGMANILEICFFGCGVEFTYSRVVGKILQKLRVFPIVIEVLKRYI